MAAVPVQLSRLLPARRWLIVLALALAITGAGVAAFARGGEPPTAARAARAVYRPTSAPILRPHPRVVLALPPGAPEASNYAAPAESEPAPKPPSDAEIKRDIARFRAQLASDPSITGTPGTILPSGAAVVPAGVPAVVAAIIKAGNEIATKPYIWGGGHGGWADAGYDCSGSVSFALAGAGLLSAPMASPAFMSWGDVGPGRWVTIYANAGHMYMIVAGIRFDTAGETAGTRWQHGADPVGGQFAIRHPPGL